VDCIDCAADASVVGAVNEGIDVASSIVPTVQRPWVMVSVNDDCRDLHFRKAGKKSFIFSMFNFLKLFVLFQKYFITVKFGLL
jgi:hypothetical protein